MADSIYGNIRQFITTIGEKKSDHVLKFRTGPKINSGQYDIPANIINHNYVIIGMDLVGCNIPLLLSKSSIKKAQTWQMTVLLFLLSMLT